MNHLDHAIQVAQSAHEGQSDKTGQSYFEHCRRVASSVMDDTEKSSPICTTWSRKAMDGHWTA